MAFTTNAGTNQAVTDAVPLLLTGTVTQDTIPLVGVLWTKDSGPDCAFTNCRAWVQQVFELYAGTYVFRFTATDQLGNTATSTTTVVVTHTTGPVYDDNDPGNFDPIPPVIGALPYTLPFTLV